MNMNIKNTFIRSILDKMTLEQKIGQCVVVGMSGTTVTNDLMEAITRYHCGGLRLSPFARIFRYFSDDKVQKFEATDPDYVPSMQKIAKQGHPPYLTPAEFAEMLNNLKDIASKRNPGIPLHMVMDQEGDVSKDLSRGGVVQFPSQMGLASSKDPEYYVYEVSKAMAKMLKTSGINMIHSPVVDVNINPKNPEIGVRAFGDDPEIVARLGIAMCKAFKEEKIIAAAKHFPGRGDSATDAHHATPRLDAGLKRLHNIELYPYKKLIESGYLDSVMVAHCIYPALDDKISTVSKKIMKGLLREELGFKGLITTDSMTMGALVSLYGVGESCARALQAGADIILMKAENLWRGETFYTIKKWVNDGKLDIKELDDKVLRILSFKYDYGLFDNMAKVDPGQADKYYFDKKIIKLSKDAAKNAIMICKDALEVLPLNPPDYKDKKILLINQMNSIKTPNDKFDHPAIFSEYMESLLPNLQTFETEMAFNEQDEKDVVKFVEENKFDLIICTNFYDRSAKPHIYPKTLIEKSYPIILITNTPYCINKIGGLIPSAKTIILNMNLTPEGLRTTADVLLGKIKPEAKWPLKNYNPLNL